MFDDVASIQENSSIQHLWPPSVALHPPASAATSDRPVVNYSLALNYALNGWLGVDQRADPDGPRKTVGYHVLNVLLHLVCGFLLFGIIRRTLRLERFAAEWAGVADTVGAVVTALWLLDPVQTDAVDYVVQRTELVVSAFYLGTLYASIRAWDATSRRRTVGWCAAAIALCLLGMASKEVMISAPLIVMLYDRAFRFTSWRDVFSGPRARPWFYAALVATGALAVALIVRGSQLGTTVGLHLGVTWYQYLYSQAWVIPHYVRLAFWPDRLTLDYGRSPIMGLRPLPGVILLLGFGTATIVAWVRAGKWGWFGFLGACFFLFLGPSSSFVPIRTEIAAERRIYLALASILMLSVIGIELLRRRLLERPRLRTAWLLGTVTAVGLFYLIASGWQARHVAAAIASTQPLHEAWLEWSVRSGVALLAGMTVWLLLVARERRWVLLALAAMLFAATFARTSTYASPEALWRDAMVKMPGNPRAYDNVATILLQEKPPRIAEAQALLHQAIALDSTFLDPLDRLAELAIQQGKPDEAKALLERAMAIDPNYVEGGERLGNLLVRQGQAARAIPILERIAAHFPNDECYVALATAYMATGRDQDATTALIRAVGLNPSRADALRFLGGALIEQRRSAEAVVYLEDAVRHDPASGQGFGMLSVAYALTGQAGEAVQAAANAASRGGSDPAVYFAAGRAMAILGRREEAAGLFRRALEVQPGFSPAREALDRLGARPE